VVVVVVVMIWSVRTLCKRLDSRFKNDSISF